MGRKSCRRARANLISFRRARRRPVLSPRRCAVRVLPASVLYTQLVLGHARSPRNFGPLEGHTHAADGANPLCGDALRCELRSGAGRVEAVRFSGAACAVATATASMLSELAPGLSAERIATLEGCF